MNSVCMPIIIFALLCTHDVFYERFEDISVDSYPSYWIVTSELPSSSSRKSQHRNDPLTHKKVCKDADLELKREKKVDPVHSSKWGHCSLYFMFVQSLRRMPQDWRDTKEVTKDLMIMMRFILIPIGNVQFYIISWQHYTLDGALFYGVLAVCLHF